jgi:hypothetical protein
MTDEVENSMVTRSAKTAAESLVRKGGGEWRGELHVAGVGSRRTFRSYPH